MALKAQTYNDSDSEYANRAEVPTYISKIAVAYGAKESTPKDILTSNGFTVIDYDLNKGCGSTTHYIYMGYKTTQNPSEAITGIFFRTGGNPPASATFDGVTAYLLGGSGESNPGENTYVDLNADAGGSYIYTYVTRDASRAAVLQGLYFNSSNSASGYVTPNVNLNSGTSGGAIYLHYQQFSGKASATFHYLNANGSRTSSSTSVSVKHHQQAVNNTPSAPTSVTYDGRTWTLLGWREDNTATTAGSTPSYTYMDSKVYRAVYSANVSLTYNANGGSGAPSTQNATQYINAGSSSIAKSNVSITIPATIPTHDATKCNFAGWNTSSSATTAQYQPGNNISINTNTILYAVWPEHNGTKTYVNIGENHVYTWSCCGKSVTEDHIYEDGIDHYCGAHIHEIDENGYCDLCDGYPATLVDGYYQINNANELLWFAEYVNSIDKTASAKLMNDIEMNAVQWTPIGTSDAYNGTFDGQGYTINNLWHNTGVADGGREGLFTLIGSNGVVKNIVLNNATIWGGSSYGFNSCGGIAIKNQGTISNCIVAGSTIQFGNYAHFGGIAGHNTGTIKNCAVRNSILRRRWGGVDKRNIGGITQTNNGTVTGCYSYDNIYEYGLTTCAISAEGNAPINSYQYTTSTVADAAETAKTKAQFASGEVAYLLQGEQTTQVWGQNIDNGEAVQQYPVFSNAKVYKHTFGDVALYSNHETLTAGGKCGDNLYWKVIDYVLTIYGTGAMWDYKNSNNISPWRNLSPTPTSLVLEEGTTHIGKYAFYDCKGFTGSLTIPNSVTTIGNYAFYYCSGFTGDLTIPNSVTTIGTSAFRDCSGFTGDLTIPNSVTSIGDYAFYNCSGFNGSLTIGNSVTTIGDYAFYKCSGFTGSLTIGNSVTTIGKEAFYYCSGFTGDLTIPNSVTTIGTSAFYYCKGFTGSLTIPNSVTTIGIYAFMSCSGFNGSLTIPNSVTTIAYSAFYNCSGFTSLTIPNSVTTIGNYAFYKCSGFTGSLTIPNSVTTIGDLVFYECSGFTGSLTIPNSVTTIGKEAFYGCSGFTGDLTIPNSVTTIGKYAFAYCSGFNEVHSFAETAPTLGTEAFPMFKEINPNTTLYYPVSGEQSYNDKGWFDYFSNRKAFNGKCGDNLYWYVDGNNTLTIYGTGAMYDYEWHENMSDISPWRNLNTAPTSLILEEGITHIGNYAFYKCSGFNGSLTIPNSVTTIGEHAFYNCSGFTGALTIGNSVTTIGNYAFYNCFGFTGALTIPNSVTTIGNSAFASCYSFTGDLTIGNSVTAIGNEAFYNCYGFTGDLTIPNSVTAIGENAFYYCSGFTGALTIPNSVTTIGNSAFASCYGFTDDLTIPNSVTSIGESAFYNCYGFTGSLTIPNSVTTIGDYAFYNCSGFSDVYSLAETAPTLGTEAFPMFKEINPNITLYYPTSGEQSYNDKGWFDYFSIRKAFNGKCGDNLYWYVDENNALTIFGTGAMYDYDNTDNKAPWRSLNSKPTSLVLEEGITHIGNYAFRACSGFAGPLTIPNSVTAIGDYAFYNCKGFKGSLTIGNSVTTIGNDAFYGCSGFTGDLTIPNSVTTIGEYAFYGCSGFTGSLTIPNSVTTIGNYAFRVCESFNGSLTIGNSVTTIGESAFAYCSSFTGSLTIPDSVTSIGNYAFYQCIGFNGDLTIGNSVTNIGNSAFEYCSGLTGSLTIPNSVTTIGNRAFYKCKGFNGDLTIGNSVTNIGNSAFDDCEGFNGALTIPNSVKSIGYYAFNGCEGFTEVYSLAETAPTLGTEAFPMFKDINPNTTLYYPVSGKQSYNDKGWFDYFSNLIGFGKCGDNLYWYVDENNALTIYGTGAMYDYNNTDNKAPWRSLDPAPTSLVLKEGITRIGDYAFYYCSGFNGSLTIPNSVTSIGNFAFSGCSGFKGSLTIGNSVTSIGNDAFYYCSGFNGSLTIPNSVTTIGNFAFTGCYGFKGSLTIGNSVTTIGEYAFSGCSGFTSSLTIPNSVTTIGNHAFYNCYGFTGDLTIGNSVTAIGNYAFYYCDGFSDVCSLAETAPTLGTEAFPMFKDINPNTTLYYPTSEEQSYNDKGWFNYFSNRIGFGKCGDNLYWYVDENNTLTIFGTGEMYDYNDNNYKAPWRSLNSKPTSLVLEDGITHIGNYAFYNCSGFTGSLTIPNSVTNIGNSAFYNCSGFDGSLTIGNSVTTIGNYAFGNCSGFKGSLTIPNSVTNIGISAFQYCSGFTGSLTIPNSVTAIGEGAFSGCSSFTGSLTFGNSVTTIGNYAFQECSGFTGSLTIPNSVTTIGNGVFYLCSGFTGSLTIPNSVTSIGNYAFYFCSGFDGSLTIGNSVTNIGDEAFVYCVGLTGSLTIPNSVTTIGDWAFYYCSGLTNIFFYRDTNPTIGTSVFSDINANAEVCVPVIWESFDNIPEDKLVKMATYTSQQDNETTSQQVWVFPEGMTEVSADDHVAINAPMVLGSQQDYKTTRLQGSEANSLWVKSFGYCGDGTTVNGSITIEDGGELYCEIARGEVTVKKDIIGYAETTRLQDNETTSETVWYTIASPLKDTLLISDPQFLSSNSDLYRYDEPTYTWQNAKPGEGSTNFQTIDPGRGYLYANAENTTLEFTGMINTDEVTYSLTTDGDILTGFHLIGNPFTHNITFAHLNATEGAELVNGYYVLNGEGAWGATLGSNEDDVIKPVQGVLVKAKSAGTLAIAKTQRRRDAESQSRGQQDNRTTRQQVLEMSVSNAQHSDRAFVVFDKGVGLDKINHENENIPLLYIPMNDTDYAIAMMDMNVNEIPVSFETKVMGQYTISLRQDNCEFDELYLLDKQTGEKVNILEQDYTFIATSSENPERFVLLMNTNGQEPTANSHFAYINNGDIVIYNIEGDADIKIFDALGRCVYHGESSDETTRIANGYSSGVYMIQKADDNGVNVQKIIL